MKVVFIQRGLVGRHNLTIGLKVSPAIRSALWDTQRGAVYLGNNSYPFSDRFHIRQCYHCQLLNHVSDDCPHKSTSPVCLYCMGSHNSRNCMVKHDTSKHCCAKCSASDVHAFSLNYRTHNSSSSDCPIYQRELQRVQNMTDFTSKNIM